MKRKGLPAFSENFIKENNYTLHVEFPELELKIFTNEKFILAVDPENTHGSVTIIRNKKNYHKVLGDIKKDFANYIKKPIEENTMDDDATKCQIQNEKLEKLFNKK
jgi:hypothetical protein